MQIEEGHREILEYFAKLTGFDTFIPILEIFATRIFLNIIQVHGARSPEHASLIIDQSLEAMQKYTLQSYSCKLLEETSVIKELS